MSMSLPTPVNKYFEIINGGDPAQVGECFAAHATVVDEKRTHQGLEAIENWQREVRQTSTFQATPLAATRDGDCLTVTARVVGDFPGSPINLEHVFVLREDTIHSLEIY